MKLVKVCYDLTCLGSVIIAKNARYRLSEKGVDFDIYALFLFFNDVVLELFEILSMTLSGILKQLVLLVRHLQFQL